MSLSSRLSKEKKRIVYTIMEYTPLLDSSNMTTDDWGKIGKDIEVLSFYSYVLDNLNKHLITYTVNI